MANGDEAIVAATGEARGEDGTHAEPAGSLWQRPLRLGNYHQPPHTPTRPHAHMAWLLGCDSVRLMSLRALMDLSNFFCRPSLPPLFCPHKLKLDLITACRVQWG